MKKRTGPLFFLPVVISGMVFLGIVWAGTLSQAVAFLAGACVCWVGQWIFVALLRGRIQQKKPRAFLWYYVLAECLKLLCYGGLFVAFGLLWPGHIQALFAGLLFHLLLFWFLFFKALGTV